MPGASAGLRIDRNWSRDTLAQNDDYGFFVGEDGGVSTVQGDGAGGFGVAGPGGLTAQVSSSGTVWTAELRIDATMLGGFGHYAVNSAGDNYRWPFASVANQPADWAKTALGTAPSISELSPVSATAGSPAITLAITGTNFISGTVALFDGTGLDTTVISSTLLNATVGTDRLATARAASVHVRNPGELDSNPLLFQVRNPQPRISTLSPNSAAAEGPSFTLTVNGSNFVTGARVIWNGTPLPTTFRSSGRLTATVAASLIFRGQQASVTVVNPDPAGGAAASVTFEVIPKPAETGGSLFLPLIRR
jgi:hypothetical protein